MSVTTDLVNVIRALPTLTALVGERFYPLTLPQNVVLPAIRYQQISEPPELTHSGPADISRPRIQLTIHASTYATAAAIGAALRAALHGSQRWGAGRVSWIENEWDEYEPDLEQYVRFVDVMIWR